MPETQAAVCEKCERLILRSHAVCPFCGARRHGWRGAERLRRWIDGRSITDLLVAANVVIHLVALVLSGKSVLAPSVGGIFGFLGPRIEVSMFLGALDPFAVLHDGEVWRLLTAAFLHAGILHIAFNLSSLRAIGPLLEAEYGAFRYAIVYLGSALLASLTCVVFNSGGLGASGAIFGLLGAGWAHGKCRGGVWGAQVRQQFLRWAVSGVVFTLFMSQSVSVPGHLGGLAGGALLGWLLSPRHRRATTARDRPWITVLGGTLLACVPIAFALDLGFGLLAPSRASIPFLVGGGERLDRWPLERVDLAAIGATHGSIGFPRGWESRSNDAVHQLVFDGGFGMNVSVSLSQGGFEALDRAGFAKWAAGEGATLLAEVDAASAQEWSSLDGEARIEASGNRLRFHVRRRGDGQVLLVRSCAAAAAPASWRALHANVVASLRWDG